MYVIVFEIKSKQFKIGKVNITFTGHESLKILEKVFMPLSEVMKLRKILKL